MPPTLLTNATIYTMERENEQYCAMLMENGKIVKLFERDPNPGSLQAKIIDGEGKTVLPGLIDGHSHFMPTAALHGMALNISQIVKGSIEPHDIEGFSERLRNYASIHPPHMPILCFNYIIPAMKENRLPLRTELDSCAPGRKVFVLSMEGHSSAYSTEALKLIGIEPENHSGILDGEAHDFHVGRMNQIVMKYMSLHDITQGFQHVLNDAVTHGLVGIHCMEGFEDSKRDIVMWLFTHLAPQFPLYLRLYPQYINLDRVIPLTHRQLTPRIGGCGAWELDGSVGSRTAAFFEPYAENSENYGKTYHTVDEMVSYIRNAHMFGLQVTAHAIGTKAIDILLNAYNSVLKDDTHKNRYRHRVDHFEFPTPAHVELAITKLGLLIAAQPGYSWMDETYQRAYRKYLRPEQFQRQIPLRKIVDMGGIIIGGSDSPVQDYNPFMQIHGMVNFPLIHERLTVYQAFRTYTINGAYATFEEGTRGTLIPGKHADFILLNANPFTIDSEKILDLTVHATYIRGAEIHPFDRSSKQVIVHGLFGSGNPL